MRRSVFLVVLVLSLGGCSLWGPEGGPGGAGIVTPPSASAPPVTAVAGADGVQRIEVTMGDDLRFTPSLVRARPGVIEFVFRNTGATAHDVRVDSASNGGASSDGTSNDTGSNGTGSNDTGSNDTGSNDTGNLNGGGTGTVRVTVERPGRYPFPCLYHVSSGMQGTLEVL